MLTEFMALGRCLLLRMGDGFIVVIPEANSQK